MSQAGSLPGRESGFTLIELLVVMTVMALVAAMASPMYSRIEPRLELRAAAETLRAELRRSRSVALRDNRETTVTVDLDARRFAGDGQGQPAELPESVAIRLVIAERERIDKDRGRIRFFPDGTSTGGRIELGADDMRYALEVDWFDGAVTLEEPDAG